MAAKALELMIHTLRLRRRRTSSSLVVEIHWIQFKETYWRREILLRGAHKWSDLTFRVFVAQVGRNWFYQERPQKVFFRRLGVFEMLGRLMWNRRYTDGVEGRLCNRWQIFVRPSSTARRGSAPISINEKHVGVSVKYDFYLYRRHLFWYLKYSKHTSTRFC